MIKLFKEKFTNIDKHILKIMKLGFKFSLFIAIIATIILLTYDFGYKSPDLYYSGLLLFKTSTFFLVDFIVSGFAIDTIKKQMI